MNKAKLISCPYNPCHQIRPERIQYHLIRCEKQHPGANLIICPYNATHHVPRQQEQQHIMACPDRRVVEMQRYRTRDPVPGQHGMLANPAVYGSASIPPYEDPQRGPQHRRNSGSSSRPGRDETSDLSRRLQLLSTTEDRQADREVEDLTAVGRRRTSPSPLRRPANRISPGALSTSSRKEGSPYPGRRHTSPGVVPMTSSVRMEGGAGAEEPLNLSVSEIRRQHSPDNLSEGFTDRSEVVSVTSTAATGLSIEQGHPFRLTSSGLSVIGQRGLGRGRIDKFRRITEMIRRPGTVAAAPSAQGDASSVASSSQPHSAFDANQFDNFQV